VKSTWIRTQTLRVSPWLEFSNQDLGGNYFDELDSHAALGRSVHKIERLGYKATLEAARDGIF
jgi:hypothetical protein